MQMSCDYELFGQFVMQSDKIISKSNRMGKDTNFQLKTEFLNRNAFLVQITDK